MKYWRWLFGEHAGSFVLFLLAVVLSAAMLFTDNDTETAGVLIAAAVYSTGGFIVHLLEEILEELKWLSNDYEVDYEEDMSGQVKPWEHLHDA